MLLALVFKKKKIVLCSFLLLGSQKFKVAFNFFKDFKMDVQKKPIELESKIRLSIN